MTKYVMCFGNYITDKELFEDWTAMSDEEKFECYINALKCAGTIKEIPLEQEWCKKEIKEEN